MIIGGVDFKGPSLCGVDPDGASHYEAYITSGSGSLAAMGIFET